MEKVDCTEPETEKEDVNVSVSDGKSNGAVVDHKPPIVHKRSKVLVRRSELRGRRSSKANWTEEEDEILDKAVKKYKAKNWKKVAFFLPGRTDVQCLHRWQKVINPDLLKGPWTKKEDNLIIELVGKQGAKNWSKIAKHLPGRMGKQCRERWFNHLKPDIIKSAWTKEEERILIEAHAEFGNKWVEISKLLPGRTENSVKNHWNCTLKRKLDNCLTCRSAYNLPEFTVPALNGDEIKMHVTSVVAKQTLGTNRLPGENVDCDNNGERCCKDLVLGYPYRKTNNPLGPPSLTFDSHVVLSHDNLSKAMNHSATSQRKVTVNNTSAKTDCHPHCLRPSLNSKSDKTSSQYLTRCLNSPLYLRDDCKNARLSCPNEVTPFDAKKVLHSDENKTNKIYSCNCRNSIDHDGMSEDKPYAGLCYEPPQKEDLEVLFSTGRFPCTNSFIRQPNYWTPDLSSTRHAQASSDSCSSPQSILRSRAGSYGNIPTIIRKRAVQSVPSYFNTKAVVHEVPKVGDDQLQTSSEFITFSPEDQNLEKMEAIKSVGRCLEKEFSDA